VDTGRVLRGRGLRERRRLRKLAWSGARIANAEDARLVEALVRPTVLLHRSGWRWVWYGAIIFFVIDVPLGVTIRALRGEWIRVAVRASLGGLILTGAAVGLIWWSRFERTARANGWVP
jgi:hypothetical protein